MEKPAKNQEFTTSDAVAFVRKNCRTETITAIAHSLYSHCNYKSKQTKGPLSLAAVRNMATGSAGYTHYNEVPPVPADEICRAQRGRKRGAYKKKVDYTPAPLIVEEDYIGAILDSNLANEVKLALIKILT